MAISFKASKDDMATIHRIADRALKFAKEAGIPADKLDFTMDITATHCSGCPLDLGRFLAGPDSDFIHDVFGIRRHLNRDTGELEDCFLPRYAARVAADSAFHNLGSDAVPSQWPA